MNKIKTSKICELKEGNTIIKLTVTRDFFNEAPKEIYCYIILTLRHGGKAMIRPIGSNEELYEALKFLIEDINLSVQFVKRVYFRVCQKKRKSRYMELFGFDQAPFEAYFNCLSKKAKRITKKVYA